MILSNIFCEVDENFLLPGVVVVGVVIGVLDVLVVNESVVVWVVGKSVVVWVVGKVVVGYGVLFSQGTSDGQLQMFKFGSQYVESGQDLKMGMLPSHWKYLLQS